MSDIALALIRRMVELGVLDADDIDRIASTVSGDDAHLIRCAYVQAFGEDRFEMFEVINGGKSDE